MSELGFKDSPLLVFATGLAASALTTALVFAGSGATGTEVTRVVATGVLASAGAASTATVQRMGARKASESLTQAQHEADHDPLTGLANRSQLYRELELSLEQARTDKTVFGVFFLDLDRFKVINDSMGHDAGDDLLRIVADRLRAATRSTDVVARLGGDEFVVICRGLIGGDSVEAAGRQILKSFSEPVLVKGRRQKVSMSVGIAIASSEESRSPEELVRDADAAMYKAKRDRSGYAVFDDAQRSLLVDRLDIERDLTRAIEEQQLLVYYQPIMNVRTNELYGFEALVRWDHPKRGMVSPGDFLPIAEDARLMSKIGEMVLREACAQAAVWDHLWPEATRLRISVNVAEQQLVQSDFPDRVAEVLAWSGIRPDQLVLEITEDVIVEHLDGLTVLRQLRDLGVSLAIDDFGTGQSSLAYIKQFDMVSTLKIDQSFVKDMHGGQANQAIVEAIVAMASALGLAIVAEGVEDERQLNDLAALGVDLMQGYLFNRPLSAAALPDFSAWLERETTAASGVGLPALALSHRVVAATAPLRQTS